MPILLMIISVIQSDGFMSTILPETQLYLPAYSNHFKRTTTSLPYYQTQLYLPVYTNHFKRTTTSLPYYQTQLYLPVYTNHFKRTTTSLPYDRTQLYLLAYRDHLYTITSTCLPYYQRHNCIYMPTETTLQQHPPIYHQSSR